MSDGQKIVSDSQINQGIQLVKQNVGTISQTDMRVWELVTDVPAMKVIYAWGCAILNVLLAGGGTIVSAFLGDNNLNKTQLVVGIL